MTADSPLLKRVRHLSFALIVSGVLNIGALSILLYWVLKETPPTPYCELKPATASQQYTPLTDQRGCAELLGQLSHYSFSQLVNCLSRTQLIENGYAERDLALACLMAFYHFDMERALAKDVRPQQVRSLSWKPQEKDHPITLVVYPDLTHEQFEAIIQFAKTERWPLTAEGLFLQLKEQSGNEKWEDHLVETFMLTPEFWTVELLFHRLNQYVSKKDILAVLLGGDWKTLEQFTLQQRQLQDSSDARRQKFLLDYVSHGSSPAAILLVLNEWDFTVKKLNDAQVIAVLKLLPPSFPEGVAFAKEMLVSPRSTDVWKSASDWLYAQSGEATPVEWSHHAALIRFVPEKASIAILPKIPAPSQVPSSVLPIQASKGAHTIPVASKNPQKALTGNKQEIENSSLSLHAKRPAAEIVFQGKPKMNTPIPEKLQLYVVQEGDTLWKIANRFGVKVDDLKQLNGLKSDVLKEKTVLKMPPRIIPSAINKSTK